MAEKCVYCGGVIIDDLRHHHNNCFNIMMNQKNTARQTLQGSPLAEAVYLGKVLKQEESDEVNHPSHYTFGSIECIDAMEASSSREDFTAYLRLAVFKYIWRWKHKGNIKDMKKAQWYLNRMITTLEKDE